MTSAETERQAGDFGIDIVSKQTVNPGEKDFRPAFEKMAVAKPDLYLLFLETPDGEIARRKMLELGIGTPVATSEFLEYTPEPELFNDTWGVNLPSGDSDFNRRLRQFGNIKNTFGGAYIYDIAGLMVAAFENAPGKDGAAAYLQSVQTYDGEAGRAVRAGNFFSLPAQVTVMKSGEAVPLE